MTKATAAGPVPSQRPAVTAPGPAFASERASGPVLQRKRSGCGSEGSADGGCAECQDEEDEHRPLQRLAREDAAPLTIAPADHALEREAEHVASSIGQDTLATPPASSAGPTQHRPLLRLSASADRPVGRDAAVPSLVNAVLSTPGHPLEPRAREILEPRLGHDFSRVRVHDDSQAAQSARAVGAVAYTVGRHVVLGAPDGTRAGLPVLAHELAHVVQQGEAPPRLLFRHTGKGCLNEPGWNRISAEPKDVWLGANVAIENHYKNGHPNNAILTGSDFEYGGKPGSRAVQLPKGAPDKKAGDRLLNKFLGTSRQLAPDVMDLSDRTFYEIKTLSGAGKGGEQLLGYYKIANEIAAQEGDPSWNINRATWYPEHVLAFPGDRSRRVCTEATDYKRSQRPGLIVYEAQESPERKKEKEKADDEAAKEKAKKDEAAKAEAELAKKLKHLKDLRDTIKNQLDLSEGEHKAQRDLIYKPSVTGFWGFWTNRLFNKDVPLLSIWDQVHALLTRADAVLQAKKPEAALNALLQARRAYLAALADYTRWKDGIQGAATKMQIAIGVTAVAIVVAVVAPTVVARAAQGASSSASGAAATEQTLIRIADVVTKADQTMLAVEEAAAAEELAASAALEAEMAVFRLLPPF